MARYSVGVKGRDRIGSLAKLTQIKYVVIILDGKLRTLLMQNGNRQVFKRDLSVKVKQSEKKISQNTLPYVMNAQNYTVH